MAKSDLFKDNAEGHLNLSKLNSGYISEMKKFNSKTNNADRSINLPKEEIVYQTDPMTGKEVKA